MDNLFVHEGTVYELRPCGLVGPDREDRSLDDGIKAEQVRFCVRWILAHCEPATGWHRQYTSYALKHQAERLHPLRYVSNGALILALLQLGWRVRPRHGSYSAEVRLRFSDRKYEKALRQR